MAIQLVLEDKFKLNSDKALNGLEALELVKNRQKLANEIECKCGSLKGICNYKLIFMDCNMPIMDGFEASSKIKAYLSSQNK